VIRVAVVDDHQVIREGFSLILGARPDVEVVLQAEDGREFVDAVRSGAGIDVALVDIRMPRLDGLAATRELASLAGAPAVIVVTTFEDDGYVLDAIAAGAQGFLLKRCSGEDLVHAVRAVAAGEAVLAPSVTRAVMSRLRGSPAARTPGDLNLTGREAEILGLIGEGLNNTEIAERLYLSLSTVKSHVSNVLTKTGSRDRVRAALLAVQEGFTR
jgi:DNA-binding NarL/FixJ family response regulator